MMVNSSTGPLARAWLIRFAPPITSGSLGPVDRLGEAPYDDEVAARRLFAGRVTTKNGLVRC